MAAVEEQPEKHCWVCFATERDDHSAEWVSPCRCKGCTKWIHQSCLQRWLDEKQKGNSGGVVSCPQCGTEYHVVFPKMGPLVYFLQQVDRALSRVSPFAAVGVVVGTVYWSAVTYGAVTVMQVVGHKKGLYVMERADPLFLLMGLPTIPVVLVLGKMIRWEDYLVRLWHKRNLPPGSYRYLPRVPAEDRGRRPSLRVQDSVRSAHLSLHRQSGREDSVSTGDIESAAHDAGGLVFVLIKGVLKVYFKQQQYIVQANRNILNYPERNGNGQNEGGEEDTEDTEESGNE